MGDRTAADYALQWFSTDEERYETDMNARAEALLAKIDGVSVIGAEGGTNGETADNEVMVLARREQCVRSAAVALAREVGHDVSIREFVGVGDAFDVITVAVYSPDGSESRG